VRLSQRPTDVGIRRLEAAANEMESFVKQKANKHWHWLAMDATTHQGMTLHVGDRRRASAKELWATLLWVYRDHATFHTDQSEASRGVIPAERHKALTKHVRQTHHSERCNKTLRPRVARLVRKTLSCSKKLAHHIGALKSFMCSYNSTRAPASA
jgi:insertion element IS1 protein InsB